MRSDDLTPFLSKPTAGGTAMNYRQGTVITWNQATAENTILVGGTIMENLPILNTSEAALLGPGDVVGILVAGATWGILGRFTIPGSDTAVTALAALRTASQTITANENITSATYVEATTNPGPAVEVAVGASGRLLVFITGNVSGQHGTVTAGNTALVDGRMAVALSGANVLAAGTTQSLGVGGNFVTSSGSITLGAQGSATRVVLFEGLNPGLTTVTAMYLNNGSGASVNFSNRNITAMAI